MNHYMSNTLTGLRSVDRNMRGFLEKGLSFSGSKRNLCRDETETNIFCSDMVGADFITGRLLAVSRSPKIVRLEIEDLIAGRLGQHQSLVQKVEEVIFCNDREWESIRFIDSILLEDFGAWQQVKDTTMRSHEVIVGGMGTKWQKVIVWRANIEIPKSTSVPKLLRFFKAIKQDQDFVSMSLQGVEGMEDFAKLIDWRASSITRNLTVDLECGWSGVTSSKLLNCCLFVLKHPERVDFGSKASTKVHSGSAPGRIQRSRTHSPMRLQRKNTALPRTHSPLRLQKKNSVCIGTISRKAKKDNGVALETEHTGTKKPQHGSLEKSTESKADQAMGESSQTNASDKHRCDENTSAEKVPKRTPLHVREVNGSDRRSSGNNSPKKTKIVRSSTATRAHSHDDETIMTIVESFKNPKRFSSPSGAVKCRRSHPLKSKSDTHVLRKEIQNLANLADLMAIKKTLEDAIANNRETASLDSNPDNEKGPDYDWELGAFRDGCASRAA